MSYSLFEFLKWAFSGIGIPVMALIKKILSQSIIREELVPRSGLKIMAFCERNGCIPARQIGALFPSGNQEFAEDFIDPILNMLHEKKYIRWIGNKTYGLTKKGCKFLDKIRKTSHFQEIISEVVPYEIVITHRTDEDSKPSSMSRKIS